MRLLNLLVICALVFAAAYVYRIKMNSTARTEQVMRLRADIREQRDAIAALRAKWAELELPVRLQGLVERHTSMKPIDAQQYDSLKTLPERPPRFARPGQKDPIATMIEELESDGTTGSIASPEAPNE